MKRVIEIDVRPCPCCGTAELDVGVQSAQSYGVRCPQCRLTMARYVPDGWPKGVYKRGLSNDENFVRLAEHTLREAVEAWNCRLTPNKHTATIRI